MAKQKNSLHISKKTYNGLFLGLYIIILLFSFFKTYDRVFDEKISLGGDNAAYYILGNSIAMGYGYKNIHTEEMTEHNHFPPGYPLIIAAATKMFTNDISFIKKVNGFFLLMSIGLLFLIIYKITGNFHWPFICCLFSLYNYHLLNYSFIMMSEIPYLFFSMLSILLVMITNWDKPFYKSWPFIALLLCVPFTYYIRSTGLALFAGILLYLLFNKKWQHSIVLSSVFVLSILPWYIRGKHIGGNAYVNQLFSKNPYRPELGQMGIADWFVRFWNNLERYITREIPNGMFNFIKQVNGPVEKFPLTASEWIIGILVLAVLLFGLLRLKKHFMLILFYCGAYMGILLLWPDVWIGIRFILPLVPLLIFLFINGAVELLNIIWSKFLKNKYQLLFQVIIVLFCLFSIKSYGNIATNKLELLAKGSYAKEYKNYFELAKWIKDNTPAKSVTCCRKGQLFFLYSTKFVTGFKNTLNVEEQIEYLKSKNVKYVVLDQLGYSSTGRYLFPAMKKYSGKFKVIKQLKDPDTYLTEFFPERGYWGEWKNDKREGIGTYTWEDNKKFVGEWKNDLRNGKGVLYFPDSIRLEGYWTNDTLNGRTILRDKNGEKIEESIYKKNVRQTILYRRTKTN